MRRVVCLLLAALAAACCSCSGPVVPAVGESDDLIVVRDTGLASSVTDSLAAALEHGIGWLLDERTFKTTWTTPAELGDLRNRRHVLLVGTWDQGEVRDLATRMLARVRPETPAAFTIEEDVWADGQVVGALVAMDEQELSEFVVGSGAAIRDALADAARKRLMRNLREDASKAGVTRLLENRYGWSLCLPSGYDFVSTHDDSGFVFFRRTRPDRSVFVYWQPGSASQVTSEYATAMREQLARRYYDGDEIEWRRPFGIDEVELDGARAVRLSGWWGNTELIGGGPFRTYCMYSETDGRLYLVDVSLFAPGLDKVPLFRHLDAIAGTFRVAKEAADN